MATMLDHPNRSLNQRPLLERKRSRSPQGTDSVVFSFSRRYAWFSSLCLVTLALTLRPVINRHIHLVDGHKPRTVSRMAHLTQCLGTQHPPALKPCSFSFFW